MRRRELLERALALPLAGGLGALLAACGADGGLRVADDVAAVEPPASTPASTAEAPAATDATPTPRRVARIAGRAALGGIPLVVVWHGGALWTLVAPDDGENPGPARLARVAGDPPAVSAPLALDGMSGAFSLAVDDAGVWMSDELVRRIDPASGGTIAAIDVGGSAYRLLAADGVVWAIVPEGEEEGRIVGISAVGDRVLARSQVRPAAVSVTPFASALWALDVSEGRVRRYDPGSLAELGSHRLRPASGTVLGVEITAYADVVWAAFADGVLRLDPVTGAVLSDTPATEGELVAMAAGSGAVWTLSIRRSDSRAVLQRLDPVTGRFTGRPLATGTYGRLLATGGGAVWVADSSGMTFRVVPTR